MSAQNDSFDQLRLILLSKDKEEFYQINDDLRIELLHEIEDLKRQLDDPIKFSQKIEGARPQIIDILGPVMGRMIRKYIQSEIEKLNESIQQSKDKFLSKASWRYWFKRDKEMGIHDLESPKLLEILLINKESGLLVSKFSKEQISDPDVVAGMFTAIKSFVETVFDQESNELGLIDYSDHKILLQTYGSYYYAIIFTGVNHVKFKETVLAEVDSFSEKNIIYLNNGVITDTEVTDLSIQMENHFEKVCKKLEQKSY